MPMMSHLISSGMRQHLGEQSSPKIRKAKPADIKAINKLSIEMHNHIGKLVGLRFSKQDLKHEMIDSKDLKKENYYVSVADKQVIGFISFSKPKKDEWYGRHLDINGLSVAKKFRSKGIGKKLFDIVLKEAKKKKLNIKVNTNI
jgi:predicted N-acetyltransferase YhbS